MFSFYHSDGHSLIGTAYIAFCLQPPAKTPDLNFNVQTKRGLGGQVPINQYVQPWLAIGAKCWFTIGYH